ncbi:glycerophosphodiester phosphodiesterase family protein [Pseudolysinimonas sp.]|uniref:glycerophosphodiester phosphodiesterase family protein n=1 Tax=Pseudolysinimonas sp. TaxID=2680009 RepID=UPI00286B1BF9|nr:glycerophosphodiester phosphodiesterase family protein [Pseudolysinimonas sp.]
MRPPRPLVIGHRGASGYRPEHTRSAYELAITLGVDAIEPDIVATRDGVLVLRHENEISGTTDVAAHPEFADRRATKRVDGVSLTGWFTEDFTWAELSTLRATERLPQVRQASATFDGTEPILRLRDLLEILDAGAERTGRPISVVAEVKHPTYFASIGLPLDELIADELKAWDDGPRIIVECFEQTVLGEIRERGVRGRFIYLVESRGSAPDLVARFGDQALPYSAQLTDAGLARLAKQVDGVSVDKSLLLRPTGAALVARAHAVGLDVFTWTLRPENRFLAPENRVGKGARDWGDWRTEFDAILGTGVDGIFVDHPDLGVQARAEVTGET